VAEEKKEDAAPEKPAPVAKKKAAGKPAPKEEKAAAPKKEVVVSKRSKRVRPPKLYSFEQWAARKGIPPHHRGGLRAFVKKNPDRHRTEEQWDECFKGY
jgi:hypothetical protein